MSPSIHHPLIALAILPFAAPVGEIAFRPAEGERWRKSFVFEQDLELEHFGVVMGGEEIPADFLPQMEMSMRSEETTVLADRYGRVTGGRPLVLERRFETIDVRHSSEFHMEGPGMPSEEYTGEIEGTSPLEGGTVEFTWDETNEHYDARSSGDPVDETLLGGLVEEADLRSWLPEGEVEVGARWTIAGEQLDLLLHPGGDLAIELEGEGAEFWSQEWRERRTEGEIELVLEAIDESKRGGLARISIAGEVHVVAVKEGDLSRVPVVQGEATQTDTATHRLRGELLWDLAKGMPEHLALEADVTLESLTVKDGGDPEYEHVFEFSGSWELGLECERVD